MQRFLAVVLLPAERAVFGMTVSKFNLCGKACGDSVQLTQGPIPPGMGNYGMGQMEQHQVRKFVPHSRLEYLSIGDAYVHFFATISR